MPTFKPLTREDLATVRSKGIKKDRSFYYKLLKDLEPGNGGEIELDFNESKVTAKVDLKLVARTLNKPIKLFKSESHVIRFEVLNGQQHA